jgi:hypothetical protein
MKRKFIPMLAGLAVLCVTSSRALAQEFRERISKEFPVSNAGSEVLTIYNINGPIEVQGYAGDKVVVDIDKVISASDSKDLDIGKQEFKLGFDQHGDSIIIYIAEPIDSRPHEWRDYWRHEDHDYEFQLSFTVKVPYATNLHVSTVNNGDINIADVSGQLGAYNVNGPITIKNAKGTTKAHTVNGDLKINYLETPSASSDYYTLNGKLEVFYPSTMSAVCQFKSMNGSFYTDFPDVEVLPPMVTRTQQKTGNGVKYRLISAKQVKIGIGNGGDGKLFKFETLNGDIYVRKQS